MNRLMRDKYMQIHICMHMYAVYCMQYNGYRRDKPSYAAKKKEDK